MKEQQEVRQRRKKKPYASPRIVYETKIEVQAGSPSKVMAFQEGCLVQG